MNISLEIVFFPGNAGKIKYIFLLHYFTLIILIYYWLHWFIIILAMLLY